MIDIAAIEKYLRESFPITCHSMAWVADMVESDVNGTESIERALDSAEFYGDSKRLAEFIQLIFIVELAKKNCEWADEVIQKLDNPETRMWLRGISVPKHFTPLTPKEISEQKELQCEIDQASEQPY